MRRALAIVILTLQYATYYCFRNIGNEAALETCRYLLDMGASRDWTGASRDWTDEIGKCVDMAGESRIQPANCSQHADGDHD